MADPRVALDAFKEWGAVIKALENGDQIGILRRGHEDKPRFSYSRRRFWLIPTYDHQKEDYIQPLYRDYVSESEQERDEAGDDHIRVSSWVQAKTMLKIEKNERLNWLTDYVVYSPRALQERFQLQPNEALYFLIVRVYNLPDPRILNQQPEYGTCSSGNPDDAWVELKQRIPMQADNPAIDLAEFEERKNKIRARLIRDEDEREEPMLF
ncbi:MAG: DUF1802 family protein [bacterium]